MPYRTLPALQLPEDVALPACFRCKAEFLDKLARESLAPLLAKLYAVELRLEPIARLREVERIWGEPLLLAPPEGIATKVSAPRERLRRNSLPCA